MKTLTVCALALACATPLAAQAASLKGPESVVVRHGDLDLNRSMDAGVMVRRIERAALSACGASQGSVRAFREAVRRSACYGETVDRAVATLNAPAVTAIYRDRAPLYMASN